MPNSTAAITSSILLIEQSNVFAIAPPSDKTAVNSVRIFPYEMDQNLKIYRIGQWQIVKNHDHHRLVEKLLGSFEISLTEGKSWLNWHSFRKECQIEELVNILKTLERSNEPLPDNFLQLL